MLLCIQTLFSEVWYRWIIGTSHLHKGNSSFGVEFRRAEAQLTSAEVLLVHTEAACAPDGPGGLKQGLAAGDHPRDGVHRRDRIWHLLSVVVPVEKDVGVLWKAEVSAKVVDTLHSPFTGIIYQRTLINIWGNMGKSPRWIINVDQNMKNKTIITIQEISTIDWKHFYFNFPPLQWSPILSYLYPSVHCKSKKIVNRIGNQQWMDGWRDGWRDEWHQTLLKHVCPGWNLPLTVYEMGSSGSRESACVRSTQRATQFPSMSIQTVQPHWNKWSEQIRAGHSRACVLVFFFCFCFFFSRLTSLSDSIPAITSLMGRFNVPQRLLLFARCLCWRCSNWMCEVRLFFSCFSKRD